MADLFLEVLSPDRVIFSGFIKSIMLPAADGDMTVLPGYEPTITSLNPGLVVVTDPLGQNHTAFVAGGFVEITGSRVNILAHRAIPFLDLTPSHLSEEILHHEMIRDSSADPRARQEAEFVIARLQQVQASMSYSGKS